MRAERAEALGDGEEHRDGLGPDLQREDLADGQVPGASAGRGEVEDHRPAQRLGDRVQRARLEQLRGDDQQHAGEQVGAGDHLAAADRVEQPPDGQRAEQVPGAERHEVVGGVLGRDVEEVQQDQPVGEEDRVVQERLRDHQRPAVDRPARVVLEQRSQQGQVADLLGRADQDLPAAVHRRDLALGRRDVILDLCDRCLGGLGTAVHDLPAGALRQVPPDEDDDQREHRADQVGDPPAEGGRDVVQGVQGHDGAEEGAGPVGAVDRDVHPAPVPGRDHLVDGRVDRRVLTSDAHPGDHPGQVQEDEPVAALRRGRGQAGPDQVDRLA